MTGPRIPAGDPDYQSILDAQGPAQRTALQSSMYVGVRAPDPARQAQILTLADQTKLPADVVARNFDRVKAHVDASQVDYQQLLTDTPGLAAWLSHPDNAALARNEIAPLQRVDRGVSLITQSTRFGSDLVRAGKTGLSELDVAAGSLLAAYGRVSPEAGALHVANANRDLAELRAAQPDYAADFARAMTAHGNDVNAAIRTFSTQQEGARRQGILAALRLVGAGPVADAVDAIPAAGRTVGQVLGLIAAAAARPRGLAYATVEGLTSSLPALAAGYAGATGGAAIGSVVPGIGTAAGAGVGLAAGTFLGAAPAAVGQAIISELEQRGVDVHDVHALTQAFNDPTLMAAVRARAERQGITSATIQSLFAGFAGKIAHGVAARAGANAGADAMTAALSSGASSSGALAAFDVAEQGARAPLVARAAATTADAVAQASGMAAADVGGQIAADKGSTQNLDVGRAAATGVQMLGYGFGEAAIGASMRGLLHADPVEAAQQATTQAFDALQDQQHVQALAEIGAAVKEAATTSQVPGRVKDLVEAATGGDPNARIYFQSDDWDAYWQSRGASPAAAAAEIIGDEGKSYYAAKATGSRLVIPIADYIAKVAPTDAWEGLLPHARTSVDGMSLGEAHDYMAALPATLTEIAREAHGAEAKPEDAPPSVGDKVSAMLQKAGVPSKQIAPQAALYDAAFRAIGERAGIDPVELFDRYALEVTNENARPTKTKSAGEAAPLSAEETEARANLQAAAESALERGGLQNEEVTAGGTYDTPLAQRDASATDEAGLFTFARTPKGTLRSNLAKVSVEGLIDELARLHEANTLDATKAVPSVIPDENFHTFNDGRAYVGMKGAAVNAAGRMAARNKSIVKLDAHLAERGVEDLSGRVLARIDERAGGLGTFFQDAAPRDTYRVYHGNDAGAIEGGAFDLERAGSGALAREGRSGLPPALYFTDSKAHAAFYGRPIEGTLHLQNPLRIDVESELADWMRDEFHGRYQSVQQMVDEYYGGNAYAAFDADDAQAALIRKARSEGHDGVVVDWGNITTDGRRLGRTLIALHPDQFSQTFGQEARGRIQIGANRQMSIDLLKDADRSTFLHETGHFYLEMMHDLAATSPAIATDLDTIRQWVGNAGDAPFTREQHEQFARGFEAYLMEGKAPTAALADAFQRFRTWLTGIYRSLRRLDVELTPDVRRVFDRLLATDDELHAAETTESVEPLFPDPAAVGLSESQAESYGAAVAAARQSAEEEVTTRVMKEIGREESSQWKEWRAPIAESVTAEVNARPDYRALAYLEGKNPDGTPLDEGTPRWKLEREALRDRYPELALPDKLTAPASQGGMDPDIAAEVFGFDSGRDLVEALAAAPAKGKLIASLVDARMQAEHGERMSEGDLKAAAVKAVRGEKRAAVLRKELEILASDHMAQLKGLVRAIAKPIPSTASIRAEASRIIGATTVTELRPIVYERAARKLATQAREALLRGDVEAAFDAKRKELLTTEVFRAATDAKESIETALEEFKKVFRRDELVSKTRDMDLVNAARSILAAFGIGRTDKPATAYLEAVRRYDESTYESIQAMVAAATEGARDYRQLPYDDFAALRETVSSLWTLARRSRQIEIDGMRVDREVVQGELAAHLLTITPTGERPGTTRAVTNIEKQAIGLMGVGAALRRAEHWVREVDGGDAGVFRRYLWNPISEAATRFRLAKLDAMRAYAELVKPLEGTVTSDKIKAPELGIGYEFSGKRELLGALLHRGNESNLQKLLRGKNWGQFDPETRVLDTNRWDTFEQRMQREGVLTKADYDFVQSVWDFFDTLKPGAQKAHRELYGHYFDEITAAPFATPYGNYRGGYFPAKADPFIVPESGRQAEAASVLQSDNSSMFPSTGRGFTKSRVEAYAKPLIMDALKIPTHIDAVLRFTHINPAVMDVARVVRSRDVAEALDRYSPVAIEGLLDPWLRRTAQQAIDTPTRGRGGKWLDDTARWLRRSAGMQILSASATVAIEQVTHIPTLAVRVSTGGLARGLWEYARAPKATVETIHAKSDYMKTRETAAMMEVRRAIDHILLDPSQTQKAGAWLNEHAAFMARAIQHVEDHMAWSGAYGDAIGKGRDEREAVRHADAIVRETLGAYEPESISRFEASSPFVKLFSMFYGFFNTKANFLKTELTTTLRDDTGFNSKAATLAGVYFGAWLVPAVMASLIKSQLAGEPFDKDNDGPWDDVLGLFWKSQLDQAARLVPLAGPLVQTALEHFGAGKGRDIVSSPALTTGLEAFNTPGDVAHAVRDRMITHKEITDLFTLIGLATGTPARPLAKPIGYLHDLTSGQATSSGPLDFTRGLLNGRAPAH